LLRVDGSWGEAALFGHWGNNTPPANLDGTEQTPDCHELSLSYASLHLELCNKSIIALVSEVTDGYSVFSFEVCLDCCQAAMPEDLVSMSRNWCVTADLSLLAIQQCVTCRTSRKQQDFQPAMGTELFYMTLCSLNMIAAC